MMYIQPKLNDPIDHLLYKYSQFYLNISVYI